MFTLETFGRACVTSQETMPQQVQAKPVVSPQPLAPNP